MSDIVQPPPGLEPRRPSSRYLSRHRTVGAGWGGLAGDLDKKVDEALQPLLDEGNESGWTLHSWQMLNNSEMKLTVIAVWIVPEG